jgi:hypothetical protein
LESKKLKTIRRDKKGLVVINLGLDYDDQKIKMGKKFQISDFIKFKDKLGKGKKSGNQLTG